MENLLLDTLVRGCVQSMYFTCLLLLFLSFGVRGYPVDTTADDNQFLWFFDNQFLFLFFVRVCVPHARFMFLASL